MSNTVELRYISDPDTQYKDADLNKEKLIFHDNYLEQRGKVRMEQNKFNLQTGQQFSEEIDTNYSTNILKSSICDVRVHYRDFPDRTKRNSGNAIPFYNIMIVSQSGDSIDVREMNEQKAFELKDKILQWVFSDEQ